MSNASVPVVNALNGDLFLELGRYFEEDDIKPINRLLRISRILKGISMERYQWKLTYDASRLYLKEEGFRSAVRSRMTDPRRTLLLAFHKLEIPSITLNGDSSNENESQTILVNTITCVRKLSLWDCPSLRDVGWLANIHSLQLWNCNNVADVFPLKGVHTLFFYRCYGIVDVNVLGGAGSKVRKLSIDKCDGTTDISGLGDIEEMRICECLNVIKFMSHCTCRSFHLKWNDHLVDAINSVSALKIFTPCLG